MLLLLAAGAVAGAASSPSCPVTPPDAGTTLQVSHAFGPCSPLGNGAGAAVPSWAGFLADQASRDASRLLYLDSLAVAGRAYAPIASGRQLLQTPTYVVRARLGTPPQQLLLAVDTSNDAAWIPCSGCAGCPTTMPFNPTASRSYRAVPCGSPACVQAPNPSCSLNTKSCGCTLERRSFLRDPPPAPESSSSLAAPVRSCSPPLLAAGAPRLPLRLDSVLLGNDAPPP